MVLPVVQAVAVVDGTHPAPDLGLEQRFILVALETQEEMEAQAKTLVAVVGELVQQVKVPAMVMLMEATVTTAA